MCAEHGFAVHGSPTKVFHEAAWRFNGVQPALFYILFGYGLLIFRLESFIVSLQLYERLEARGYSTDELTAMIQAAFYITEDALTIDAYLVYIFDSWK